MDREPPRSSALQVIRARSKHTVQCHPYGDVSTEQTQEKRIDSERGNTDVTPPKYKFLLVRKPGLSCSSGSPSKCTWGPVALPVEPTSPTCCPLLTLCTHKTEAPANDNGTNSTVLWCQETTCRRVRQLARNLPGLD